MISVSHIITGKLICTLIIVDNTAGLRMLSCGKPCNKALNSLIFYGITYLGLIRVIKHSAFLINKINICAVKSKSTYIRQLLSDTLYVETASGKSQRFTVHNNRSVHRHDYLSRCRTGHNTCIKYPVGRS